MEDRLNRLLEKYWEGETDLNEEAELKSLLAQTKGYADERRFFHGLTRLSKLTPDRINLPKRRMWLTDNWMKIAASLAIILAAGATIYVNEVKRAEQKAYLQVMEALSLIQENMQKGTSSMAVMQEMKHLNTTQEIFQIPAKQEKK